MNFLSSLSKLKPLTGDLEESRRRGAEFFSAQGLPTRKDEAWKYTSVKALTEFNFASALAEEVRPSHETLKALSGRLSDGFCNLVVVNGRLDRTLSDLGDLPTGLSVEETVAAPRTEFGDSFEALSAAYLGQGLILKVAPQTAVNQPVRVLFYTHLEGGPALMVHPRLVVELGESAKLTLLESYEGQTGARYFVNPQTEIRLDRSARLQIARAQDDSSQAFHIGRSRIDLGESSELTHLSFTSGAILCRHQVDLILSQPQAFARIDGAYAVSGVQHVDHHTLIDHRVGHCTTTQTYKGLLDGTSRAVFHGEVRIRPGAQKANSEQLNNNLLLKSTAEADSQPRLLIEADDVKATHGSTVGHLNEEELFYLMSRGLSRAQAIPLLSRGFLAGLFESFENENLKTALWSQLNGAIAKLQLEEKV